MVYGHYIKVRKQIRMVKNPSDLFLACCEEAGVKPTVRQRNKFERGVGAAFKLRATLDKVTEVQADGPAQ